MHQHAQENFVPGYENVNFCICNFSQFFTTLIQRNRGEGDRIE